MLKFKKTPAQARRAWVRALRSGKYKQGDSALRSATIDNEIRFCCLGVACDLFKKMEPQFEACFTKGHGFRVTNGGGSRSHASYLPPVVRHWLGLANRQGKFDESVKTKIHFRRGYVDDTCDSLVELNDSGVASFKRIAQVIEREPKGLLAPVKVHQRKKAKANA